MTNILVFGDSISWGAVDEEKGGWVERLKLHLAPRDIEVYNCGVSGDDTFDLLKRFKIEAKARLSDRKTIVIFAIGINDSQFMIPTKRNRVDRMDFEKNLIKLNLESSKLATKTIFLGLTRVDDSRTTPIPWRKDTEYRTELIKEYDSTIRKVCTKNHSSYVSVFDLLEFNDLYDGLHPNAEGHIKIFKNVERFLKGKKYI